MLLFFYFVKKFILFLRFQPVVAVFVVCCFQVNLYGQINEGDYKKYYRNRAKLKKEDYQKAIEFYRSEIIKYSKALKFDPDNYDINNDNKDNSNNTKSYNPYNSPNGLVMVFWDNIPELCKNSVEIIKDTNETAKFRKYATETLCIYFQLMESAIIHDEDRINKMKEYFKKMYPLLPQRYSRSGIYVPDPSEKIKELDKKPDNKEELLKVKLLIMQYKHEMSYHNAMSEFKYDFYREVNNCIYLLYSQLPTDYKELEYILEKYKYPLNETVEIFVKLKIPYKGFRQWQSKDGLFRSNAKFIELRNGDVFLELTNGKRTEIELKYLCKDDQDYVKRHESEKKTVDGEKVHRSQ